MGYRGDSGFVFGGVCASIVLVLLDCAAQAQTNPADPLTLIQELCLDSGALWEKAQPKLQARAENSSAIREEKLGKATLHHLDLPDGARVELTVSNDDNAVMSCTIHAQVADIKATFAVMQKRYRMKGVLADYMLGKSPINVPFVP